MAVTDNWGQIVQVNGPDELMKVQLNGRALPVCFNRYMFLIKNKSHLKGILYMERLWTKSYIFMIISMLFLFTGFYMLYPTMPLFIKQIGGSESDVGLAMGAFMLSSVILRPLIGVLIDRYGRRMFVIAGIVLFGVVMYMYDWTSGILFLFALRIIHGFSWAISTTSVLTAVTDMIPSRRRGEGLGWSGLAMTIAMAVGPMIGIWIVEFSSYQALFLFATSLTAIAFLFTLPTTIPFQPQASKGKIVWFEKSVFPVTLSVFFLFFGYGSITTFVPLFSDSIRVNAGLFFLIYAATLLLSRPIAGKLSDRYGETFVITPALIMTVIALFILSAATGVWSVVISAILYGIGFGAAQPALQASIIRLVQPDQIGVANASFTTAADLGIGIGAILLGWLSQFLNYQGLFIVSALFSIISLVVFLFFVKRLLENKKNTTTVQANPPSSI